MSFQSIMKSVFLFAGSAALAGSLTVALPHTAHSASLKGTWSGGGSMTINSKGTERVRCRVTYSRISGQTFRMNARCASGAGRLSQSGTLSRVSGNTFQGSVYNAKYGVSASVYVKIKGRRQSVYISSAGGSGSFTLRRR